MEQRFCGYTVRDEGVEMCDQPAAYEVIEPDTKAVVDACLSHVETIRRETQAGIAEGYAIRSLSSS